MIKLIIYDLDNTLFDTYNQLGKAVLGEMISRMRKEGLTAYQETELRKRYSFTGFRIISRQLGFNPKIVKIGMHAYEYMDLRKIKPYKDINILGTIKIPQILVTSGVSKVQQSKVDILKIRKYFKEVIIDTSVSIKNKQVVFQRLMKKYKLKPEEILIVGDNPESEIAAGKKLNMITVQILRHKNMRLADSDYRIRSLMQLKKIILKYK